MKLSELLNNVKVIQVVGNAELKEVEDITYNSQLVRKNSLFFAIEGFKTDGHKFIPEAISQGASAVVLTKPDAVPEQLFLHSTCVKIVVEDSRKSLAEFSNIFYGKPSERINLCGVTGTKGKTTTAFYLKNIFENAGYKSGLIGTIANFIGKKEVKTMLTTPQSNEINSLLCQMINEDCLFCVMEVSSHALDLHRVDFLKFKTGIFTNITSDHMDYHKTFQHYLNSKKILFDMLPKESYAVVNLDDPNVKKLLQDTKAKVITYGTNNESDFKIKDIEFNLDGTSFSIEHKRKNYKIKTKLVGHFNAFNATAAFAASYVNDIEYDDLIKGIKSTPQVPGRFEVISKKNKKVIIDYSHTADSLKQALIAVHHIVKNERPIYTVFGCGGDRDRTKRPVMGKIASEMSKKVYVTSDNPRTEDPKKIIKEILTGIKSKNYIAVENREEAIRTAIFESEDNAVILIAGKGHENYQEINGVRKHFSDKEVATKYLKEWAK